MRTALRGLMFGVLCVVAARAGEAPVALRVDLLLSPERTVIVNRRPPFAWRPAGGQVAYQIQVATDAAGILSGAPDQWDSGRVEGAECRYVPCGGKPLSPDAVYFWRVRTWENVTAPGPWSAAQTFHMAPVLKEQGVSVYPLETVRLAPRTVQRAADGGWFLDFGREAFGWLEITVDAPVAGGRVTVRLGEKTADGAVDRKPGASLRAAEAFVTLEAGLHTYRVKTPADRRNTSGAAVRLPAETGVVLPFRYVDLQGLPEGVDVKASVSQVRVQYPFDEGAAVRKFADARLQALWDFCKYSIQATTFAGTFVDGDRERIPYEADAFLNQLGYYAVSGDTSLPRRTYFHLLDHPTWPTEWKHHMVLMALADYEQTGDPRLVTWSYERLRRDYLLLDRIRPDGLLDTKGLRDLVDWPAGERDGYDFRPVNTVVNAFEYRALIAMTKLAGVAGKDADATAFANQAEKLKARFNAVLFDDARGVYVDGEGSAHASLHASAFALACGLVPPERRAPVVSFIKSRKMACSPYGAFYVVEGLWFSGERDAARALLTSEGPRSWRNMLDGGGTITWEAWNAQAKPNLDWNHAWAAWPVWFLSGDARWIGLSTQERP